MKKLLPGTLAAALAFAGMLSVHADEITTTTVQTPPAAPVQVLDSYMKPVVTQTKSTTTSDGNTHTSTAPMIMERHETVAVPTSQVTTTTTATSPKVVEEEVRTAQVATVKKATVHRARVQHRVAHRRHRVVAHRTVVAPKTVAYTHVRKVIEPQVIQQTQTVEQKGVIIDRKDPSLDP